jgi:CspA family cold shock protein
LRFIRPDVGGDDIFFHISNVQGIASPVQGMAVQYQVGEGKKGPEALNVQSASSEQ